MEVKLRRKMSRVDYVGSITGTGSQQPRGDSGLVMLSCALEGPTNAHEVYMA